METLRKIGISLAIVSLIAIIVIATMGENKNYKQVQEAKAVECKASGRIWIIPSQQCRDEYDFCLSKVSNFYQNTNDTGIAVANDNESISQEVTRCLTLIN